jgi:Flp pilus assembly CpaF family ATPase
MLKITDKEKSVLAFFDQDVVDLFSIVNLTDIFFNANGSIFTKIAGKEEFFKNYTGSLRVILNEIAYVNDVVINESNPVLECSFIGMRITAVIAPVSSMPTLTIRKPNYQVIPLEQYVKDGVLKLSEQDIILENFITYPKNILICGATGSGKTTFANALLDCLTNTKKNERIVSIQDTPELVINCDNLLSIFTTNKFSIADCLKVTLRQSPKRILIGEVRDKSVIAMLEAFNTGHHGGLATIHANSATEAIQRIISLAGVDYDLNELYNLISITIGLVISIQEIAPNVRKITQILAIKGYDFQNKKLITQSLGDNNEIN